MTYTEKDILGLLIKEHSQNVGIEDLESTQCSPERGWL